MKMAGLFGVSAKGFVDEERFKRELFLGTLYHQHLREEYSGLAVSDGKRIKVQTHRGLFKPNFENNMEGLGGSEGIGYCGSNREPCLVTSKTGQWGICFSGNLRNKEELEKNLMNNGHVFEQTGKKITDVEIIIKLIAQEETILEGLKNLSQKVDGAYSILVITADGIYATRCPSAQWPLVIGKKNGTIAVASESGGFKNIGFEIVQDLKPGQIVLLKNGKFYSESIIEPDKVKICSFLWVYTSFPTSRIEGIPVSLVRKRLGAALARKDIEAGFIPHLVAPVPDSGRFHAIGYIQEFTRQLILGNINRMPLYDEILVKFPHIGRSYTPSSQQKRNRKADIKLLTSSETTEQLLEFLKEVSTFLEISLKQLELVLVDDSIVRGTQSRSRLVPKIKSSGIDRIHLRVSNPELPSHCPWGKSTKKGELLVFRKPTLEERTKHLGVKSLRHNAISDLVDAIGLPEEKLCVDCDLP